jgi:hypothetical protein
MAPAFAGQSYRGSAAIVNNIADSAVPDAAQRCLDCYFRLDSMS